jgi:regulatory protein SWI6
MQTSFNDEMRQLQDRIDTSMSQIRELSTQENNLSIKVESQFSQIRSRLDRKQRIQNLRRAISDMRDRIVSQGFPANQAVPALSIGDADKNYPTPQSTPTATDLQRLPDVPTLNSWLSTYNSLNASLAAHLNTLKSRDSELEAKYRKVVSLCTNVPENKVDELLSQLVLAVESEPENDVGRVREFLKRVEAVTGAS